MRARTLLTVLLMLLAGLTLAPAPGAAMGDALRCEAPEPVPYVGMACRVKGGFIVVLRDGSTGFTHGYDAPADEVTTSSMRQDRAPPTCVPTTQKHNQVLYVQPLDKTYRPEVVPILRDLVNRSNGVLRAEAAESGATLSYRFACDGDGLVTVQHAHINLTTSQAAFGDVVSEVRRLGFTHANAKYWMWLDGGSGGGVAYIRGDDRLVSTNANLHTPDYALTYGATGDRGVRVLMHESGHNLGAVQLSAPHTSGGWHCNDGLDIMCYGDGGSKANYTTSACPTLQHFDCGHDDYFHPSPPDGSYLATHWNLAHPFNQLLDFSEQPPSLRPFWCSPSPARSDQDVRCSLVADAPGKGVAFDVDWGDGVTERVPATGYVPSGSYATAAHAWTDFGTYAVTVTATDNGTPPRQSAPRTWSQHIDCVWETARNLQVGLQGIEIDNMSARWESGWPAGCAGRNFTLDFGFGQEFDLCWYDGMTLLQCHRETGAERGIVPEGADRARVIYRSGVFGAYFLKLGVA